MVPSKKMKLVDFLFLYNGRSNVFAFAFASMFLYLCTFILTLVRAALEENNGWATAVCILNLVTFGVVSADARFWSFSNAASLFFVITAESLCLAANIMICFTGEQDMRATSIMVLFLVFLQKGLFVSYVGASVIRAITSISHDHKTLVVGTAPPRPMPPPHAAEATSANTFE